MYGQRTASDDQYLLTSSFERLCFNQLQQNDDIIKEHFNDLQLKLQDLDVLHHSSINLNRTITPSSRDSGIPIPSSSSSSSSLCSSISERTNSLKSSLHTQSEQENIFEFFLHPSKKHSLNKSISSMSYNPYHQSQKRSVHWDDESIHRSKKQIIYNQSDLSNAEKRCHRISLNASLPYHSKLNIRIQANRTYTTEPNPFKATATVQQLTAQDDYEHMKSLRQAYCQHYSTLPSNDNIRTDVSRQYDKLPQHRQISLPISLPIDQRLVLYIHNDEVLARC